MNREDILNQWLSQVLKTTDYQKTHLAGDASFRRYYRIFVNDKRYVVMDAPPPEAPHSFVEIAQVLQTQGISVPSIQASELKEGFLLLSDLGDRLYLAELNESSVDHLYKDAFQALFKIQQCRADIPHFDRPFLQKQFWIFKKWFLEKHLGFFSEPPILESTYQQLVETIELQPTVFVHRDYHSRNLMILEDGSPGVLDFQDAMLGPITYDLVSLLQDCYITWPRERVEKWVKDFQSYGNQIGLLETVPSKEFLRWFDWTGLQRHLKNLGIFSRLYYRDGKSQYLKDIPRVLQYIQDTCARYPELKTLGAFFDTLHTHKTTLDVNASGVS